LPASRRTTGAVAKVLSNERVVSLHPCCGRCIAVSHCAINHVKAWLPLVQPQLETGTATPREVLRPPLDVEDAVGSSATYRSEYAEPAIDQIKVVPIWVDGEVVGEPRQALVGEGRIRRRELGIAVGRQIDRGEALVVQRIREWQRHGGYCIVPVIADVGRAWHDATSYLIYHVRTDARRGC
jgi:hypothetical protein